MTTRYQQLQAEDRVTLAAMRQQGQSLRQIASVLGRSASTLSRELRRNSASSGYSSGTAHRASQRRRIAEQLPLTSAHDTPPLDRR